MGHLASVESNVDSASVAVRSIDGADGLLRVLRRCEGDDSVSSGASVESDLNLGISHGITREDFFEIVVREHLNGIQIDVVLFKFDCQLRKTNVSEETADSFFLCSYSPKCKVHPAQQENEAQIEDR